MACRFNNLATQGCPCGFWGEERCRCSPDQVQRYRAKISGPLLDRIDLQVQVSTLPKGQLTQKAPQSENSAAVRQRVVAARAIQLKRNGIVNARLNNRQLEKYCPLDNRQRHWLESAIEQLQLSARAYHRVLKVARTIADLAGSEPLLDEHLAEAVGYRLNIEHRQ